MQEARTSKEPCSIAATKKIADCRFSSEKARKVEGAFYAPVIAVVGVGRVVLNQQVDNVTCIATKSRSSRRRR